MSNRTLLAAIVIATLFISVQSCKKSDPAPTPTPTPPTPTVKPDTLTAGWSKQVISTEPAISDIFFNNATNGYLCTDNSIYKTTNGGTTWDKLSSMNATWNNCFVTNDSKAFFVKYTTNIVYRTTDGGTTFTSPTLTNTPTDIFFTDNSNGYSIALDGFYNSVDGGTTWQKIATTGLESINNQYASLAFVNNTTGWVVSQSGIYKTNGSLTTWQKSVVTGGTSGANFLAVSAVSASVIYVTNSLGEIFKSTDGGANFSFIKKLEDTGFTDIQFISALTGYASSGRSIYKTIDAGTTWSKVVSLGQNFISEIHFTDETHGWACGNAGVVLTFK